jgi:hypothetical protein
VNLLLVMFSAVVLLLLILLFWLGRKPKKHREVAPSAGCLEQGERPHITYLPQVRQALARGDYDYLSMKASPRLARRVRQERRKIALTYLSLLRRDFQKLLRLARMIAVLSPEVAAVQELERLRLSVKFAWRCEMIRLRLFTGLAPAPQLGHLSDMVSGLNVRIEAAMKELGERAALAAELASSLDRRGVNPA